MIRPQLALAAIGLFAAAAAHAGESDAPALLSRAGVLHGSADQAGLIRLVESDRVGSFLAVELLLRGEADAPPGLAEALARAYQSAFADPFLVQRVALFARFSPEQRRARDDAYARMKAARQASNQGRQQEALADYEKALEVFRRVGDLREEARCLLNMAASSALLGESRAALDLLDAAAARGRITGDQLLLTSIGQNRSYALEDLGDLPGARAALEEALPRARAIGDLSGVASMLLNLSNLMIHDAAMEEAERASREAARLGAQLEDEGVGWAANLNLAAVLARRGDLAGAEAHLQRAARHARDGGLPYEEAGAEINLANNARRQGDLVSARRHMGRARRLASRTDVSPLLGQIETTEADLLLREGRYAETLPFLDAAQSRLRQVEAHVSLAEFEQARALAHYYLGHYEQASEAMRRALDHAVKSSRRDLEADCRANLGRLLSVLGDAEAAVRELEISAALHRSGGARQERAGALMALGSIRRRAGDAAGARLALEEAVSAMSAPGAARERLEAMVELAALEREAGAERQLIAGRLLDEASDLAASTDDLRGVVLAGLLGAEWAVARHDARAARETLDAILARKAGAPIPELDWRIETLRGSTAELQDDPQEALRAYRRAIQEVETLRGGVGQAPWKAAILEDRIAPYRALVRLHLRLGQVEEAYQAARSAKSRTFVERLRPPDYSAGFEAPAEAPVRIGEAAIPPTSRLRVLIRPKEAILDLYVDGDDVLAFVVTRAGLVAHRLETLDMRTLSDLCSLLRHPGLPPSGEARGASAALAEIWKTAAARLGEALIEPVQGALAGVDHLLIVPTGEWHGVPFAALTLSGRRLIERWDLTMLPAAEALLLRRREPQRTTAAARSTLALGDPEPIESASRLPGSADEALAVARLSGDGSVAFVGDSARESALRSQAQRFERIHLAAHGRVDPIAPARSYIALAAGDGHDGRLEAAEIATLSLRASLVVLSGCRTGEEAGIARGRPVGDERFGLVRAFLAAGAGSVVAGLWESEDRAARAIMPAFYAQLAGRTPAQALALLQREMAAGRLTDQAGRPLDHPFYWAGLAVYGAGR